MIETIKRADFQLERDQQSGFGTLRTERGNLPLKKLEVQSQKQIGQCQQVSPLRKSHSETLPLLLLE